MDSQGTRTMQPGEVIGYLREQDETVKEIRLVRFGVMYDVAIVQGYSGAPNLRDLFTDSATLVQDLAEHLKDEPVRISLLNGTDVTVGEVPQVPSDAAQREEKLLHLLRMCRPYIAGSLRLDKREFSEAAPGIVLLTSGLLADIDKAIS